MEEEKGKNVSCPLPSKFTTLETFDHIDLIKICEFFKKYTHRHCEIVHKWYSADLGILRNRASLCIDLDPSDQTNPTAVFIYTGPRKKDSQMVVCLGKIANVGFIKGEDPDTKPWYLVEITDETGVIARFSATGCHVFSSAYLGQ